MSLNPQNLESGREQYEKFQSHLFGKERTFFQYDYRDADGELFSTVAPSLNEARLRRDRWREEKDWRNGPE